MVTIHVAAIFAVSFGVGLVMNRFNVPAGLILAGLLVAATAQIAELTPGTRTPKIALPAFLVLGSMIGARFSGINLSQMRRALFAGLATTGVAVTLAMGAALIIAAALKMPPAHVIAAFAPGGDGHDDRDGRNAGCELRFCCFHPCCPHPISIGFSAVRIGEGRNIIRITEPPDTTIMSLPHRRLVL